MNQGAWYASQHHIRHALVGREDSLYLNYAGREPSAAAAAGYVSLHVLQQTTLVEQALLADFG